MLKNDPKDQIPLFEMPEQVKTQGPPLVDTKQQEAMKPVKPLPERNPQRTRPPDNPAKGTRSAGYARTSATKPDKSPKAVPGPVPEGDVRLTANIREELHLKLKIVAATRRTTIGELIEELVELHL